MHVPHIVFVGQLPYSTTAEALEAHLRTAGVVGAIKIRLLTDKKSGAFKGLAFAELDDAEDQHKCIQLHHSLLGGRRINVEKSCGGRNKEQRKTKITAQRNEQKEHIAESVDRVLADYESRGVLPHDARAKIGETLMKSLHALPPSSVAKVDRCE